MAFITTICYQIFTSISVVSGGVHPHPGHTATNTSNMGTGSWSLLYVVDSQ